MASTYTPLGVETSMATGENAGTWGTKTNTNLQILVEQSILEDYTTQVSVTDGSDTTALTVADDGSTGATLSQLEL